MGKLLNFLGSVLAGACFLINGCGGGETGPVRNISGMSVANLAYTQGIDSRHQDTCTIKNYSSDYGVGVGWMGWVAYKDSQDPNNFASGDGWPITIEVSHENLPLIGMMGPQDTGWYSIDLEQEGIKANCFRTNRLETELMLEDQNGSYDIFLNGMGSLTVPDFWVYPGGPIPNWQGSGSILTLPPYYDISGQIIITCPTSNPIRAAIADYNFYKEGAGVDFFNAMVTSLQEDFYPLDQVSSGVNISSFREIAYTSNPDYDSINVLKTEEAIISPERISEKSLSLSSISDFNNARYIRQNPGKKLEDILNQESAQEFGIMSLSQSSNPPIDAWHIQNPEDIDRIGGIRFVYVEDKPSGYQDGMIFQPRVKNGSRLMMYHKDYSDPNNPELIGPYTVYIHGYADYDIYTGDTSKLTLVTQQISPVWEDIHGQFQRFVPDPQDPNVPLEDPFYSRILVIGNMKTNDTLTFPEPLNVKHDLIEFANLSKFYLNNDPNTGYYDAANDYNMDGKVDQEDLAIFCETWLE